MSVAASSDDGNGAPVITVNSPPSIAGNYGGGSSNSFAPNPAPQPSGQTADVIQALDAADGIGPADHRWLHRADQCSGDRQQHRADRSRHLPFQIKANNAEAAGAIAVIIVNNVPGRSPLFMGGSGAVQVNIPVLMVSFETGILIKAQLGTGVNATLSGVTAADTIATFSSRGPSGAGSNAVKPDIAAPGLNITAAQTGITCIVRRLPQAGPERLRRRQPVADYQRHVDGCPAHRRHHGLAQRALSGTFRRGNEGAGDEWRAARRFAIRERHPAAPRPDRIGAGRVDPVNSLALPVTAFNADEPGVVSLSYFGEVVGTQTQTKRVRVVNHGLTSQTFDLSFDTSFDAPGISFSLPGGSTVTVPAGGTAFVPVQVERDRGADGPRARSVGRSPPGGAGAA